MGQIQWFMAIYPMESTPPTDHSEGTIPEEQGLPQHRHIYSDTIEMG